MVNGVEIEFRERRATGDRKCLPAAAGPLPSLHPACPVLWENLAAKLGTAAIVYLGHITQDLSRLIARHVTTPMSREIGNETFGETF